MKNVFVMYAV